MSDHPALTDVEEATGVRLEAGHKVRNILTDDGLGYQMTGHDVRLVLNALAERDEIIMRLAGELTSVRTFLEVDDDTKSCTLVMLAANMVNRMERAESDLAAMTTERDEALQKMEATG